MKMIRSILLLTLIVLGSVAPASVAQSKGSFFIEAEVQTVRFYDESVPLVGLWVGGDDRSDGLSYDLGLHVLIGSASTDPPGLMAQGNRVDNLGLVSGALRYVGSFTERLRYDLGGFTTTGLATGQFCGATDVCTSAELYVGAGPEAGLTVALQEWLGVRVSAGYPFSVFEHELDVGGPSWGMGVRFRP